MGEGEKTHSSGNWSKYELTMDVYSCDDESEVFSNWQGEWGWSWTVKLRALQGVYGFFFLFKNRAQDIKIN